MASPRPQRSQASSSFSRQAQDEDEEDSFGISSPISAADMATRSARKRAREATASKSGTFLSPQQGSGSSFGAGKMASTVMTATTPGQTPGSRLRRSLSQPPAASVVQQEIRKSLATLGVTPLPDRSRQTDTGADARQPVPARKSLASFQQSLQQQERTSSTPRATASLFRTPARRGAAEARGTPGFLDTVRRNKELQQQQKSASKNRPAPSTIRRTPFAATRGISGWGAGIGESPMDLLVQLAMAPGLLPEPTPRERPAPSFVRPGMRDIPRRGANLRPGEPVPGDLTRDEGANAADASMLSDLSYEQNEQARQQRSRQSARSSNVLAQMLQDEGTSLMTPASLRGGPKRSRTSLFSIGEPSGLRDGLEELDEGDESEDEDEAEEDIFGPAVELGQESEDRTGLMNAFADALEGFEDDDSTRLSISRAMSEPASVAFDESAARLDDFMYDNADISDGGEEEEEGGELADVTIQGLDEQDGQEQDTSENRASELSKADAMDSSRLTPSLLLDKSLIHHYDDSDDEMLAQIDASSAAATSEEEEDDDEDALTRQQVRKAQMGLLRRRVARRKHSRKSPITGRPTPMLPPSTVRRLFDAAVQPSKGSLSGAPVGTKRQSIALENGVVDAVEEASHEFIAEFTRQASEMARQHGRSRTITEQDAMAVIKAQGFATPREPIPTLARRYLPRELSDLLVGCLSTPMANGGINVTAAPSSSPSSGSEASYSPTKRRKTNTKTKGKATRARR